MISGKKLLGLLAIVVILVYVASSCFVAVGETEIVAVTSFGRLREVWKDPGLHLKAPDPVETAIRLDARLQILDSNASEYLTRDKKNLVLSTFILWRLLDAKRFLESVGDAHTAALRLADLATSELGLAVGTYDLSDFLDTEAERSAIEALMAGVTENCRQKAARDFGIEMVDVRLRRMNFPQQNLMSVFNRMKAERERMAKKYLAEGDEQAKRIRAETDQEVRLLLAEADKEARITRGQGEADATRIYAEAHQAAPDYYQFTRKLEAYKQIFDDKTTLILSVDSPLFDLLRGPKALNLPQVQVKP